MFFIGSDTLFETVSIHQHLPHISLSILLTGKSSRATNIRNRNQKTPRVIKTKTTLRFNEQRLGN